MIGLVNNDAEYVEMIRRAQNNIAKKNSIYCNSANRRACQN